MLVSMMSKGTLPSRPAHVLVAVLERLRDLCLEIERVNPAHESGRSTR